MFEGDKSINYGRVLEIMGMLSGSGFTKVALISEPYKEIIKVNRNIFISLGFHTLLVIITAMSLPFLAKKPIDLPPIVSVELNSNFSDKTNIPFAPKAKKIIEKVKEKERRKKIVSEQAPTKNG